MAEERGETPGGTGRPPPAGAYGAPAGHPPARAPGQGPDRSPAEDTDARMAELEDRWLRSAAELDNLRKRVSRDVERVRAEERARIVREWLPIVDNLDLALRHADAEPGAVVEGVRAVRDQAVATLARLGFPRHEDLGVPFDPAHHEAVGTVADPEVPAGTVAGVVRPGYGDGERQLRPAAVIVSTAPDRPEPAR
ncbi:nucleotide exchange factor GrpE [Sphaerisporangium sp. NPDC005288]|uniref:nucleotide exchange factor GrpE n=1 Tax=Sphaerisporangium sp. NPDC005288 TaxID=3155114 RepID=UPI0033A35639